MPWICKVDTPLGKKGENAPDGVWFNVGGFKSINHKDFQNFFEFVEEKSDQSLLEGFLLREGSVFSKTIVTFLLENNAIKPEFLEKLRRGE